MRSRLCRLISMSVTTLLMLATAMGQERAARSVTYQPNLESIGEHQVPRWYQEAKLGIFVHWGLYSVPAWAPPSGELGKVPLAIWFKKNPYAEWYLNTMKIKDSPTWEHHVRTWGTDFRYEDFIPIFMKESRKWKPEEWAALFEETGARYVVFTTKHADGYALWPTAVKHPHLKVDHLAAGARLCGELTRAVRAQGMKMGIYCCGGMDSSFVPDAVQTIGGRFSHDPAEESEEYVRVCFAMVCI